MSPRGITFLAVLTVAVVGAFIWAVDAGAAGPTPPDVNYHRAECPAYPGDEDVAGCALLEEATAYARPGSGPATYWHELGHLFDQQVLTPAHRARFQTLIADRREWWAGLDQLPAGLEHYGPPGELFASAYAVCLMQANGRPRYGVTWWAANGRALWVEGAYRYTVRYRAHRRICQLVYNAAGLRFELAHGHAARWGRR